MMFGGTRRRITHGNHASPTPQTSGLPMRSSIGANLNPRGTPGAARSHASTRPADERAIMFDGTRRRIIRENRASPTAMEEWVKKFRCVSLSGAHEIHKIRLWGLEAGLWFDAPVKGDGG